MFGPTDLRDLFDRAVTLPAADRASFLRRMCGGNSALRQEVERLLAAHDRLGTTEDTLLPRDTADLSARTSPLGHLTLTSGVRLGPYEIIAPLGAGGMGEVYKACDTRLDRTVALKILPSELTVDPSARQRFEREARAVAALSHPRICSVFDVGRQNDIDYLVMEYVDGETLAARLRRGKLPFEQVVGYAQQISEALGAAHRAGIVHRDLKPGNIMLTVSGAKLLDFGLAKRQSTAGDLTTAPTAPLTRTGMVLGTVQYMAPEQLQGREADERTDIFAFGVVLYEMATGQRAFGGESDAVVIGQILHADPPTPSSIDRLTPAAFDELVRRCLAKDPEARWQSIADVHAELEFLRESIGTRLPRMRVFAITAVVAAVLLVGVLTTAIWWWRSVRTTPTTKSLTPPVGQWNLTRVTFDKGVQTDATFSPDGRFIAYASDRAGNFNIWVQPVAGGDPVQITRSLDSDTEPDWSPDGSTIVFRSTREGGGLFTVPALGGAEHRITSFGLKPRWSPDGRSILFETSRKPPFLPLATELYLLHVGEDTPRRVLAKESKQLVNFEWDWYPDGKHVSLYGGQFTDSGIKRVLMTVPLDGGIPTVLPDHMEQGWLSFDEFRWVPSTDSIVVRKPFNDVEAISTVLVDPATHELRAGDRLTTGAAHASALAVSRDGKHVAFTFRTSVVRPWLFKSASDRPASSSSDGQPLTDDDAQTTSFDLSSDGTRLAYSVLQAGMPPSFVIRDLTSGRRLAAFSDEYFRTSPKWSRDGKLLAYQRTRTVNDREESSIALWRGGSDEEIVLGPTYPMHQWPCDWKPDGSGVLLGVNTNEPDFSLRFLPVGASRKTPPAPQIVLDDDKHDPAQASYSPDGKWIAVAAELKWSNVSELAVLPASGGPLVTLDGRAWAAVPKWSPDGRRIYYVSNQNGVFNIWAIPIDAASGRATGQPFRVTDFKGARFGFDETPTMDFSVLPHGLVVLLRELSENIWMLRR